MATLMNLDEMERRHRDGEDPFDLAIEKWVRIREFLAEKGEPNRYKEALVCGSTKIVFCQDYKNHCILCPLEGFCLNNRSLFYQVMRSLQVYTLIGRLLPPTPLIELIESYIRDLDGYRMEWVKRSN
jgi:hypothetical protein